MNRIHMALAAGALALAGTTSAYAGDVGWSISIGSPGYYRHYYEPRVVYEPRIVYGPRVYYEPAPIYFRYYDAPRRHYHRPHSHYGGHRGHGHHKHHGHGHGWKGHHR